MKKIVLGAAAPFVLLTAGIIAADAQNTDKKDGDKPQTATVDAWRTAVPQSEQSPDAPLVAAPDESRDNVEAAETAAQTEKRIADLELRLMEALRRRDAATLSRLLADDFTLAGINAAGTQPDKARYIDWALKSFELKTYAVEKFVVRVYDTSAIVTTVYKRQASVAGAAADGDFTVTNVWIKRGKRWQAVSHHISQTPKA